MDNQNENIIPNSENKIKKILIKIIILSVIFFILLSVLIFNTKLLLNKKTAVLLNIDSLERQNKTIISQIKSIEKKFATATTYIKMWESEFSNEQKLLKGINVIEIEKKIQELANNNNISNVYINYSPVILLTGVFQKNEIKTYTTLFNIKFSSITDIDIFHFLDDITSKLGYFIVIQEVTFERFGKIDDNFLKKLKEEGNTSAVNGEIKLRIYGLGLKEF